MLRKHIFWQEAIVWQLASRNVWIQQPLNILYANFHASFRKCTPFSVSCSSSLHFYMICLSFLKCFFTVKPQSQDSRSVLLRYFSLGKYLLFQTGMVFLSFTLLVIIPLTPFSKKKKQSNVFEFKNTLSLGDQVPYLYLQSLSNWVRVVKVFQPDRPC